MSSGRLQEPHLVAAAVLSTCALMTSWWYLRTKKKGGVEELRKNEVVVDMLPVETSSMMMNSVASISTLTWYEGSMDNVEEELRKRVATILELNPWLAGHLATRNGKVSIVYKASGQPNLEETGIFTCFSKNKACPIDITRATPCQELHKVLEPLLVKKSFQLLDNYKEPYFRVCLVPDCKDPSNKFALITSLAHCVGDGHTYYTLHNMLSHDRPVTSLNVQRKPEITKLMETALGGPSQASALSHPSFGFLVRFLRGVLASVFLGPPTKVNFFCINEEWLERQKKIGAADLLQSSSSSTTTTTNNSPPSFVSTNDILTSQCFQSVACDQGIMAINFRGKLPDCLDTDAGCYFNYLVCRPEDYATPASIRSAVHEILQGRRQPKTEPMNSWEHLTSKTLFGASSNWSTFSKPVSLRGCTQELHLPLLPSDSVSTPSRAVSGLFMFKPDEQRFPRKIAAMYAGHPRAWEALVASGMVGQDVQ